MTKLTNQTDWEKNYLSPREIAELKFGWRDRINLLVAREIERLGIEERSVLEIGAGDSQWLPYLAKKYPHSKFAGLDYSKAGCERLAERAAAICGPEAVEIYHQDLFDEKTSLHGEFDLVMSFGLAEHFTDLCVPLRAKSRFLKGDGLMLTLIPNMRGAIGLLTQRFNAEVYRTHNPHDWKSFLEGHRRASLTVIAGGYLGSTNFGVLSSCFKERAGISWRAYVLLTRLSAVIGFIESKVGDFRTSRMFSPYLYAVSRAT